MSASNHIVGALSFSTASSAAGTTLAMSEQVQIVMIGAVVSLLTGLATIYFAYKAKTISQEAKDIAKETGVAVDGKMDKMLALAKELSHAEGVVQGTAEAETKAAVTAAAKAEGRAEVKATLTPPLPLV